MATVVVAAFIIRKKKQFILEGEQQNAAQGFSLWKHVFTLLQESGVAAHGTSHGTAVSSWSWKLENGMATLFKGRSFLSTFLQYVFFWFFWFFFKLIVELGFLDHVRNPQNELNCCLKFAAPSTNKEQFKKSWNKSKDLPSLWRDSMCKCTMQPET